MTHAAAISDHFIFEQVSEGMCRFVCEDQILLPTDHHHQAKIHHRSNDENDISDNGKGPSSFAYLQRGPSQLRMQKDPCFIIPLTDM